MLKNGSSRAVLVLAVVSALALHPHPVSAQETSDRVLTPFQRAVASGAAVRVSVDGTPDAVRGTLLMGPSDELNLSINGVRRVFALSDVSRIDREGDSLSNGALIGAIVLGGWCARICRLGIRPGPRLILAIGVNGTVGGLIGAAIDAEHKGTTTIYRRSDPPAVTGRLDERGVMFRIRF